MLPFRERMQGLSQIRRGRGIQTRAKRARIRLRKPRFAGKNIKSDFRAAPRLRHFKQPYLSTKTNIAELIG